MTDNGTIWADKFIKREYLPAGELAQRFNINNPRSHPEAQREATESSLDTIGWIDEVSLSTNGDGPPSLIDNPAAVMFDGHERVEIALVRGGAETLVPVRWYQLTPEETDFALLVKDQSAAMAQIVPEKMAALMERAKAMMSAPGLQGLMERLKGQVADGLLAGNGNGAGDTKPKVDKADELQEIWQVKVGDLWECGPHRVICGDCTDRTVVERVMGGERADLAITSPPYPDVEMWEQDKDKLIELGNSCLEMLLEIVKFGAVLCWNTSDIPCGQSGMSPNPARDTMTAIKLGWTKRAEIIWEKGLSYLPLPWNTRRPTVPHITHEHILIFFNGERVPREKEGFLNDDALAWNRETVWKISPAKAKQQNHKAPFPVDLVVRCLTLFSFDNDIIFDPFLGSGTTLIACHNLNRCCRGIEIEPKYVSVTLQRFLDHTGERPKLIETVKA